MKNKISVQLYSLRDACAADFPGVLRELAQIGYRAVQFAGFHGYDPDLLKSVLAETGMKATGLHYGADELIGEMDRLMAEARLFDTPDIVCAGIGREYQSEDGYRTIRREFNKQAHRIQAEGFRISYHNHAFEFDTIVDGKDGLSYLIEPAADNLILAEPDVFWLKRGGFDPVEFLKPYAGRVPLLHMKDMTDDAEQETAEIGTGTIDFEPIIRWGESAGVEWYIVEQDTCKQDPLVSMRTSYTNLAMLMDKIGQA